MKAIIIGAGSGNRIGKFARFIPKSLLTVNGSSILERQVKLFRKNGIMEVIVITGPYKEKFSLKGITYLHDKKYESHDILGSLMVARDLIKDDVIVTYSDIIFDEFIIQQVIQSQYKIGIAIDLDWEKSYEGRTEHPKYEAENVLLDKNRNILKIKKNIPKNKQTVAEFLGIIRFSNNGGNIFVKKFEELEKSHNGMFHNAESLDKAYLTDMIQELIESKIQVKPIIINGKWCEIDTLQDLQRAQVMFK